MTVLFGLPAPVWTPSSEEYHSDVSHWGSSMLAEFRDSPARAHGLFVARTLPRGKATDAQIIGTLAHVLILEPFKWDELVFVVDVVDKRTKAFRQAKKDDSGKLVVTRREAGQARAIARAVLEPRTADARLARALLVDNPGVSEYAHRFTDAATGVPLKCRFDRLTRTRRGWADVSLKTALDPSTRSFRRAVWRFGYHVQAALYGRGFVDLVGEWAESVFVVVRSHPPYEVSVKLAGAALLDAGRRQLAKDLRALGALLADPTALWVADWEEAVDVL